MAAHRIFCTKDTLYEVIRLRKERPYSTVLSTIEKLGNVYVECASESELKGLAAENPIINKLLKRVNRDIKAIKSIVYEIKNFRADDIYLMTPPESRHYVDYRYKMGLLVTTSITDMQIIDDLCHTHYRPYNLLTDSQKSRLQQHGEEYEDISSWKDVLDATQVTPINAAIIIDNYIFHAFDRRKPSLYSLIMALVPEGLSIPFHLTIFVNNGKNDLKKEKMEQVVKEIHELKLGSEIKVSIVAHMSGEITHDRKILTNYHLITSGRGFGVIDNKGVHENAQGEVKSTFHNINLIPSYTSDKHIHSQVLDWMKEIYIHKKGDGLYAFKVGDDFDNRLLPE